MLTCGRKQETNSCFVDPIIHPNRHPTQTLLLHKNITTFSLAPSKYYGCKRSLSLKCEHTLCCFLGHLLSFLFGGQSGFMLYLLTIIKKKLPCFY